MLNIYFGDMNNSIYNTKEYFNDNYKSEWIITPFAKKVIKAVDKAKVINEKKIKTSIFGKISPEKLSDSVKTLLLIAYDNSKIFNASMCGDNCAKWLLKIAEQKDITINLYHVMDFGDNDFKIKIMNNRKIVNNMSELVFEAVDFLHG